MNLMELKYKFNDKIKVKIVEEGDEQIVISHDPESGNIYEFNDVGSEIFLMVSRSVPVPQIISSLLEEYDATIDDIYEDVNLLFDRLLQLGIIFEV